MPMSELAAPRNSDPRSSVLRFLFTWALKGDLQQATAIERDALTIEPDNRDFLSRLQVFTTAHKDCTGFE